MAEEARAWARQMLPIPGEEGPPEEGQLPQLVQELKEQLAKQKKDQEESEDMHKLREQVQFSILSQRLGQMQEELHENSQALAKLREQVQLQTEQFQTHFRDQFLAIVKLREQVQLQAEQAQMKK